MHHQHVEKLQAKEDCRYIHNKYLLYNTNKENKEISSKIKKQRF